MLSHCAVAAGNYPRYEPLAEWLESIFLGEYLEGFVAAGYDDITYIQQLGSLDDGDMDSIGVSKPGYRRS